jgi:hypothetical protein
MDASVVMSLPVWTCSIDDTLERVARVMNALNDIAMHANAGGRRIGPLSAITS